MAMTVVHRLEEIDIEGEHRQGFAAVAGMLDQIRQMGFEIAPVVEPGQRIRHRHLDGGPNARAQLVGIAIAADLRRYPGQQFLLVDRPDEVVVHPHVEGPEQPLVVVRIDDDEDRRLPGLLHRLQLRADAQRIEAFHVKVDDDEFEHRAGLSAGLQRQGRIGGDAHLMLARQGTLDAFGHRHPVVDHQHMAGLAVGGNLIVDHQPQGIATGAGSEFVGQHLQPHQAFDPAEQRDVVDGLREEIIGPGFKPPHPVFRLVEGCHHHHRDMLGQRVALDAAADLDAVDPRHHHVKQHDIGLGALHRFQGIDAVHGGDDLEILRRQLGFQQADIGENVVDDQDAGCHSGFFR